MNEKIVPAVLTFLGVLVGPVASNLATKPMDVWTTAVWCLLVLSVAGVVYYILREEKASRSGIPFDKQSRPATSQRQTADVVRARARRAIKNDPVAAEPPRAANRPAPGVAAFGSVTKGFLYVLAAALCWSISNILLRITAQKLPDASFDIAVINYFVASIVLIAAAWVICRIQGQPFRMPRLKHGGKFWLVAAAKGLNTYTWILSVAIISAAAAATLEGLHVVFTILLLIVIFRVRVPTGNWLVFIPGSVVMVIGAVLILGMPALVPGNETMLGIVFGVLSALFFSLFYVLWEQVGEKSPALGPRTLETGVLLLASLLCPFPIHVGMNALLEHPTVIPFEGMSWDDIGLQALCGLIGIGGTYLFINESLFHLRRHKLCSLLLGIGLSYSVPFTMILQSVFLGEELRPVQWIGGLLFGLAFAVIYRDMRDARLLTPAREHVKRGACAVQVKG